MRPFKNSNLFSNHYLEKLLPESPEWRETSPAEAFQAIKELYERKARVLENYNESQLEENFIRPALRILGHHFGVQGTILGRGTRPDYAFFPDEESLHDAEGEPGKDYYRRSIAVGDAKSWKVSLDKQRGRGNVEMQNPSFQIDSYLRDTPPKWAILTSGRFWRLYHEATSYKLDCYYEVDLPALLEAGDLESFKYFYLFFRRESFPRVVDGDSFLDRVREGSIAFAQEIQEDLQKNVYRAMKILAEGFLAETGNGLAATNETISRVQENALRLLYRLLFIFYAESRGLLDAENKYYYELSLQRLKTEVAERLDRGEPLLSIRYSYWESCKNLFSLINNGSESRKIPKDQFYIPAYNGGLFDPAKNTFLEEKRIGDSYLAAAIDLLARSAGNGKNEKNGKTEKNGKKEKSGKTEKSGFERAKGFVDYSSLEIRHLGSIYEGLLEYRLKVADREMAAVKEKGKELWLPAGEAGKRKILDRVQQGEIFLATDKGERKATGSYYTPDYIVKYIVKNTLEPVIEKKKQEWLGTSRPFAEFLLSIKVLDPAMGSGHFLVEATDQLARWLVQAWETARPEEADSKDVAEQDVHWARREVVRHCIYGVDLNPMAVELAKLSLWLTTVASNKPLSFLDHHLRCGNSLIGAELDKLSVLPGVKTEQPPLWNYVLKSHTDKLLGKYKLMAALPDDNLQMVKWKEGQFREIRESELSCRLRELADVWLSTFFGNKVTEDDYYELQNHLSPEKFPDWAGLREQEWFKRAETVAQGKRFFHWELEFPEAFNGQGCGFDVVIGNPPYVRQEHLSDDKRYFESMFKVYHSIADLYVYFFERGHEVLRNGGFFGFISSNKFMRSNYGKPLRNYIKEGTYLNQIIDFGELPVFPEAATFPAIYLTEKAEPAHPSITIYTKVASLEFKSLDSLVASQGLSLSTSAFEGENWSLSAQNETDIMGKMGLVSVPLGEFVSAKINYGIKTGLNKAFIIDAPTRKRLISEDPRSEEILKPIILGDDIRKYEINYHDRYLIWTYIGVDLKNYPAVKKHLDSFKDELEKRWDKGNYYYELRACDYYDAFVNPKIVYPDIAKESRMTLDRDGLYLANTAYFIPTDDLYLLILLNSKLLFSYYKRTATILGDSDKGGRMRWFSQDVIRLPIRRISFTTPTPERARMNAELQQLYAEGKHAEILAQVDACLPKDAAGNFIADQEKSDVVHDLLAFLAERMLEMNKQKQQEIRGFLGWLEGYLGAKVEDLTPKTKLQSYWDSDFNAFLAVLKKNQKKLGINPSGRDASEMLKDEFAKSVGKLGPLRERIDRTDRLIDDAVFRLYGLTEEEIGIVEGK